MRTSMSVAPKIGFADASKGYRTARHTRMPQGLKVAAPVASNSPPASGTRVAAVMPPAQSSMIVPAAVSGSKSSPDSGGSIDLGYESSMHEWASPDAVRGLGVELTAWRALIPGWRMDVLLSAGKVLTGERKSQFQSGNLGLLHLPWALSPSLKYRPKLAYSLPTFNEKSRTTSSMGALSFQNRFLFAPVQLKGFNSYYQLSLNRNFYRYTTSGTGESNLAWIIGNRVLMSYDLNDAFSAQVMGGLNSGFTFNGNPSTAFLHSEELSYKLTSDWSLAVGHQNEAGLYREDGRTSNFSVVNGHSSSFYGSVSREF